MTAIALARHGRIRSASIQVVQMMPVAAISKPITIESQPDRRWVLFHDSLLARVQGVITPTTQLGRTLPRKFPTAITSIPIPIRDAVVTFTGRPHAAIAMAE